MELKTKGKKIHNLARRCANALLLVRLCTACSVSYKFNGASIDYEKTKTIQIDNFPLRSAYVWAPMQSIFQNKLTDLYMNDLINREKYESEFRALQSQIEEADLSRKPIDEHEVHSLLESYNEWSPKARKTFWSYMVKSIVPSGKGFNITLIYT